MNQHKQFAQKTNKLVLLLEKLTAVVSSEALFLEKLTAVVGSEVIYQDITIYEDDVELEILNFQIKQHLSRQGVQASDIKLATDFVNQYINE
ncbi:hypothetical protein L2737_01325 [Shewanella electrodiphila]|uniref:Uncharacterized protein n=1 Tax=Shewanella electrodiphila TaxID=934143 RepID=A0ABT0KJF7_9GAMM|nr:hypothetical protein [Shewanella electrodiphila]MCL1043975.1 hypothetical protein [Shewanella electrodiphila]